MAGIQIQRGPEKRFTYNCWHYEPHWINRSWKMLARHAWLVDRYLKTSFFTPRRRRARLQWLVTVFTIAVREGFLGRSTLIQEVSSYLSN